MNDALAFLERATDLAFLIGVGVPILVAYSLPVYLLSSLPGAGLCFAARRVLRGHYWTRAIVTSVIGAAGLTPTLVLGHAPVILPLPFALWLYRRVGLSGGEMVGLVAGTTGLLTLLLLSLRYSLRERARDPIGGPIDWWFRGTQRMGPHDVRD